MMMMFVLFLFAPMSAFLIFARSIARINFVFLRRGDFRRFSEGRNARKVAFIAHIEKSERPLLERSDYKHSDYRHSNYKHSDYKLYTFDMEGTPTKHSKSTKTKSNSYSSSGLLHRIGFTNLGLSSLFRSLSSSLPPLQPSSRRLVGVEVASRPKASVFSAVLCLIVT